MANELDVARAQLERTIADNLEVAISNFHIATGTFPRRIAIELGALVHVNNIEMPRITVKAE
jgi:hypothetical protein